MRHQTELLAPAGSFDSLRAAVNAGADAVYIGGTRFGARAYADNPDEKGMLEAIEFAHLHGCDLYMTVNTLLKDGEMEELGAYLKPYYESGLDAVIVQDLGVFSYIRENFPDLDIHASTQMTVLGAEGARFLKEQGASRVVTARELSLEEIRRIHDTVDVEIESFVHGALCYCYSGQCLMSSMFGGRSGNRGRCAQPCRLPYQLKGEGRILGKKGEEYILSPKDMCTIEILPEVLEAGVCSLKIEGRMKRPEYTAGVVRIYRKYLDRYLEYGREAYRVEPKDYGELQALYNRGGFSRGYYEVHNGREMISLTRPSHFEEKGKKALKEKQQYEELLQEIKKEYLDKNKKEAIEGSFRISGDAPSKLRVRYGDLEISVEGEPGQIPKNQPMTEADLRKQLQKTGDTPFTFEKLEIQMEGEIFCPNGQLNRMRREALEKLAAGCREEGYRSCGEQRPPLRAPESGEGSEKPDQFTLRVQLEHGEYLQEVLAFPQVKAVYLTSEKLDFERLPEYVKQCHEAGRECLLVLPAIFRTPARRWFEERISLLQKAGLDGLVLKNLEELEFVKEQGLDGLPLIGDHNLYSWNREAAEFWKKQGISRETLPLELNDRELRERGADGAELIAYGYLPLMTTAGCLHRTVERCDHKETVRMLVDRYKKEFPVVNNCRYCYNVIYNSEPLSLLNNKEEIERLAPESLRLCFTLESQKELRQILKDYTEVFCGGMPGRKPEYSYTKGHLKRGVQ
ncbi:DUF3656 domain-containing U32 family peptidase [Candidatus Merdisoma sp. HCP28S3_D10]|uniref:U32 family peptidase n=1 Tax=unclassified Candidatus Merdisoma TaxID=3099611 RepID=UPI003F8CCAAB